MSRGSSLADFFGEMIADIRHKVIEEPWFGRAAMSPQEEAEKPPADLGWVAWRDAEPGSPQADEPERGQDIDR